MVQFLWRTSSHFILNFQRARRRNKLSWDFIRAVNPFRRTASSWSYANYLTKTPPPNTNTQWVQFQHMNFGGHKISINNSFTTLNISILSVPPQNIFECYTQLQSIFVKIKMENSFWRLRCHAYDGWTEEKESKYLMSRTYPWDFFSFNSISPAPRTTWQLLGIKQYMYFK